MNSAMLIGRICNELQLRYASDSQTAICKFTLAIDDGYGEKKKTNFIPVIVFGKQAESCEKFLAKGRMVAVEGKIQTGSYEKQDGTKVYTTDVIANRVEFIDFGNKDGQNAKQGGSEVIPEGFAVMDDSLPF